MYFSRLPTLHALWNALNSGIDFNPPLFYLLTRASNLLFGEGNVATRLPEILGFWIFSLCLFRFVSRRAGALAGLVAMLFPMATGAYPYAYEARPHALVLGACGLAIVCWQMAVETFTPRPRWLIALAASLFGAFMMHCFALTLLGPFVLVELFRAIRSRRINWGIWLALAIPALLALPLYILLLRSFKKLTSVSSFAHVALAGWSQVPHFYLALFSPCILLLLGALILFAIDRSGQVLPSKPVDATNTAQDLCLGMAFLALPAFGVVLGKVVSGPFFNRYFLAAVAGVGIIVAMGAGLRKNRNWILGMLAFVAISGLTIDFTRLLVDRVHGRGEKLLEPSSQLELDTTPGKPLAGYPLLNSEHTSLPIAVLSSFDFIYLVHYDPILKSRLYFVASSPFDYTYVGFNRFLQCCRITFNPSVTDSQFAQRYPEYLVYGATSDASQLALLETFGGSVISLAVDKDHFLAHLTNKTK